MLAASWQSMGRDMVVNSFRKAGKQGSLLWVSHRWLQAMYEQWHCGWLCWLWWKLNGGKLRAAGRVPNDAKLQDFLYAHSCQRALQRQYCRKLARCPLQQSWKKVTMPREFEWFHLWMRCSTPLLFSWRYTRPHENRVTQCSLVQFRHKWSIFLQKIKSFHSSTTDICDSLRDSC